MSRVRTPANRLDAIGLVRVYVLVLGVGLLLDGGGLLVLDALGVSTGIVTSDTRDNVLYVISGIVLLGIWITSRRREATRVIWASLIFGAFYIALGVLGLTVQRPFGLMLGLGENVFHFTVGAVALAFGAWALRTTTDRAMSRPVPLAAAPPYRRRPQVERKRTSRRGKSRRR